MINWGKNNRSQTTYFGNEEFLSTYYYLYKKMNTYTLDYKKILNGQWAKYWGKLEECDFVTSFILKKTKCQDISFSSYKYT